MHFEARQGAASLIPFGKCEEGGDGAIVMHLDSLPLPTAREPMRLIVLPEHAVSEGQAVPAQGGRRRPIYQTFNERSGSESLVPIGAVEQYPDGGMLIRFDALPVANGDGTRRVMVLAQAGPSAPAPMPTMANAAEIAAARARFASPPAPAVARAPAPLPRAQPPQAPAAQPAQPTSSVELDGQVPADGTVTQ